VSPPIVQSTTFDMDDALTAAMDAGDYRSQYLYTRMGNPTVTMLQQQLARLHGAADAVATASGMGALTAVLLGLVQPGDVVVADTQLYGVTAGLLAGWVAPAGRVVVRQDLGDAPARAPALQDAAGRGGHLWVLAETVSNPLVRALDLEALARDTAAAGGSLLVDNTFAGPQGCQPLRWGARVVMESLSKSIAGHSDVHGGAVLGEAADMERVWQTMLHLGSCLDPHAAWLILRGQRTLKVRADASDRAAATLAGWLGTLPAVRQVWYPGLAPMPACLTRAGSMLSFAVEGGDDAAQAFLRRLTLIRAATSLGGVETLASLPFNTSHRTEEARRLVGLPPGVVRISVGLEAVEDLQADIEAALAG
jgi:methionine-gamma-lyase